MKKATILSIDDDPFYGELYRNILEPKGYRVVCAMDPTEGYAVAKKEKPDVILLDIMMPEKKGFRDGYGLLKEFRENPAFKDTAIIMISALGDDSDVQHALTAGAAQYLPKQELSPERLVALLSKLLKKA